MSLEYLKLRIIDTNLCTGCGLCEAICPKSLIEIDEQYLKPICSQSSIEDESSNCGTCTMCSDVCPGYDTDTPSSENIMFNRTRLPLERWLGVYKKSLRGYSKIPDIFKKSSSGGCATTLLIAAKQIFNASYIITAGRSYEKPWIAASSISKDKDSLINTCQSTYQLFPHLRVLRHLFNHEKEKKIILIGLPCHIQAIRKLQKVFGEWGDYARNNIVFLVELACSSSTLPSATELIVKDVCGDFGEVEFVKYREGEYPGSVCVQHNKGQISTIPFAHAVKVFKQHKTHRCLSCGDWMSGLADISICDGDPNIFKSSIAGAPKIQKHGRMLIRTTNGMKAIEYAVENDIMEVWEGDVSGMNLGLERKRNRRAFYERKGDLIPVSPIPNYQETGEIIDDEDLLRIDR